MTGSPARSPDALDAALRAHNGGDPATQSRLHVEAAAALADPAAKRFHLTHAWIFALEAGDPAAGELEARLRRLGGL